MSVKVYCDHGANTPALIALQRAGRIIIHSFPYDHKNRKIGRLAVPSKAQIRDLNLPIKDPSFRICDAVPSAVHSEVARIVGADNRRDVLHLDSAYKSGCRFFFTCDKKDLLSKRTELEPLLSMRFYHPVEDLNRFLADLAREETKDCRTTESSVP